MRAMHNTALESRAHHYGVRISKSPLPSVSQIASWALNWRSDLVPPQNIVELSEQQVTRGLKPGVCQPEQLMMPDKLYVFLGGPDTNKATGQCTESLVMQTCGS